MGVEEVLEYLDVNYDIVIGDYDEDNHEVYSWYYDTYSTLEEYVEEKGYGADYCICTLERGDVEDSIYETVKGKVKTLYNLVAGFVACEDEWTISEHDREEYERKLELDEVDFDELIIVLSEKVTERMQALARQEINSIFESVEEE